MIMQYGTTIQWAAAFKEKLQHAYVYPNTVGHPRQVCKPNIYLASPAHWQKVKKQPANRCKNCIAILKILGSRAVAMINRDYCGPFHKGQEKEVDAVMYLKPDNSRSILTTQKSQKVTK